MNVSSTEVEEEVFIYSVSLPFLPFDANLHLLPFFFVTPLPLFLHWFSTFSFFLLFLKMFQFLCHFVASRFITSSYAL